MVQKVEPLLRVLEGQPVIPVVAVESAESAVKLARALAQGGLPAIEITLRTPAALEAIRAVAKQVPEAIVGAGTILTAEQFSQAEGAGATFVVSPGFTPALIDRAESSSCPLLPGASSPSELMALIGHGYTIAKFFPAEQLGGAPFLKALAPVFPSIRFCPTGGISTGNVDDYLSLPNVICVGGSWVAPKGALDAGDYGEVTRLSRAAAGLKRGV